MKPRYAIVRVDGRCPAYEDYIFCGRIDKRFRIVDTSIDCNKCKIRKYYGDTKEQLIRKVITILKREKKGWFYISEREIANKIIKFLGVE